MFKYIGDATWYWFDVWAVIFFIGDRGRFTAIATALRFVILKICVGLYGHVIFNTLLSHPSCTMWTSVHICVIATYSSAKAVPSYVMDRSLFSNRKVKNKTVPVVIICGIPVSVLELLYAIIALPSRCKSGSVSLVYLYRTEFKWNEILSCTYIKWQHAQLGTIYLNQLFLLNHFLMNKIEEILQTIFKMKFYICLSHVNLNITCLFQRVQLAVNQHLFR